MAELERAGAAFGVHSNWGESGPGWEPQGHYKQCGFVSRHDIAGIWLHSSQDASDIVADRKNW